ncbi:hypothetical protein ACM66B_004197 [Microbotryomycetes sp. NB124-2]
MLASVWQWWTGSAETTSSSIDASANDNEDDSAPVTPFPTLPSELRDLVLMYTVPAPSYTNERRRRTLLNAYSLFDSSAKRWTTATSYRHAQLPTWRHANSFLQKLSLTSIGMSEIVTSVRLGRFVPVDGGDNDNDDETRGTRRNRQLHAQHGWWGRDGIVGLVLKQCPNVRELWVAGLSALSLHELSFGQNLRQLYIVETRISPLASDSTSPFSSLVDFRLPNLDTLHLWRTIFSQESLALLLNPITLPSLKTLHYFSIHQSLATSVVTTTGVRDQAHHTTTTRNVQPTRTNANSLAILTASLAQLSPNNDSETQSTIPRNPFSATAPLLVNLTLGSYATKIVSMQDLEACGEKLETLDLPMSFVTSLGWRLNQRRQERDDEHDLWVQRGDEMRFAEGEDDEQQRTRRLDWPPGSLKAVRVRDDGQTGFATASSETPATQRDIEIALDNVVDWLDKRDRTNDLIVTVPPPACFQDLHDMDEDAWSDSRFDDIVESVQDWPSKRPENGKLIVWRRGPWDQSNANDAGFCLSSQLWRDHVEHRLGRA